MKIAILGPAFPFRGGLAVYTERLAKALTDSGHEVVVYTFTLQYPSFLFPGKSQYSDGKKPALIIHRVLNSINPFNWFKAARTIRKENPELVIVKYWIPFMGPALGSVARLLKKKSDTKVMAIIHNIIPHESRPGDRLLTKYFMKSIDGCLAMSDSVYNDIDKFVEQIPKTLSPHPLYDNYGDILEKEEARKKLALNKTDKVLLFFGLIRDYKGLDLLIEAFADSRLRNQGFKLLIAGEYYTDKAIYNQLIEKHQLSEEVIQHDKFIPDDEVAHYFCAADIVVQPYKSATQSGVSQIAYHFNTPLIVTDVGGLSELCPDTKVGYVVKPQPLDITNGILRFFNETDREKMIENIKEEKKKYSWDILAESVIKLSKKL